VVRVEPARVGGDPGLGPADALRLPAQHRLRPVEGDPPGGDAEDGDDPRPPGGDQLGQGGGAGAQLLGVELGGGAGRAVDEVGDAEAVAEQLGVLVRGEPARGEPGEVQRRPEPVARPGEVVPARGGDQTRVDPDEEDAQAGADDVPQRFTCWRSTRRSSG
jgi:hypothetical protein